MKKLLCIVPLVLLFCFTIACQDKAVAAELKKLKDNSRVENENRELARVFHLAWAKRDYGLIRSSCVPDMPYYSPSNTKQTDSVEDLIKFADSIYVALSDYHIKIEEIIAEGNMVSLRAVVSGIQIGEILGVPASGKRIEWGQILMFRIENGKITEMREDYDALGLMQQLGMELKPKEVKK
jgi:steroid delta-isomerase-like uncharacterized protein